jgi:hypothetical protein
VQKLASSRLGLCPIENSVVFLNQKQNGDKIRVSDSGTLNPNPTKLQQFREGGETEAAGTEAERLPKGRPNKTSPPVRLGLGWD